MRPGRDQARSRPRACNDSCGPLVTAQACEGDRECRDLHVRGKVTITANPGDSRGLPAVLCVQHGRLLVIGGPELDTELFGVLCCYVIVTLIPGKNDGFFITINGLNQSVLKDGVCVKTACSSARDRWLDQFSAMGVKIEGLTRGHETSTQFPEHVWPLSCMNGKWPLVRWIT